MSSALVEQLAVSTGQRAGNAITAPYHVHSWRPWMSLYGLRLRTQGSTQAEVPLLSRAVNARQILWQLTAYHNCISMPLSHHEYFCKVQVILAPIQKLLPPELTTTFLRYLPITTLAHCQCVCKQWNALGQFPPLWQSACQEAFSYMEYDKLSRLVRSAHK